MSMTRAESRSARRTARRAVGRRRRPRGIIRLVSTTQPSAAVPRQHELRLAFTGNYVIQGNYNGYQIWDISNPQSPSLKVANYCPASQSDVSVYKNLLFVSAEGATGRIDCGDQGVKDPVSKERIRGVRIFDITDIAHPKNVANVQTCRGSHTHTVLVDPNDKDNVYVYVSGSSAVRPAAELPGCSDATPASDPNSALFRIEVIKVPLAHPERGRDRELAAHLQRPRGAADARRHGRRQGGSRAGAARRVGSSPTSWATTSFCRRRSPTPMLDSIAKARGGAQSDGRATAPRCARHCRR